MHDWILRAIALVAILAVVLVTVVASRRSAAGPARHTWREMLASRAIAVIVITAFVAVAKIEWGAIPAVIVAVVGVAGYCYWAITHGHAGWPFPWPSS